MIPIRDTLPSGTLPVITYLLMGVNLLVFVFQLQVGLDNEMIFYADGLVPAKYTVFEMREYFPFWNKVFSLFSYMFMHGGFVHFLGNMWSLFIFGDNVEEHLGAIRYLAFYLACGLISGAVHFLSGPVSMVPTIGASGAIAGVMGAYFLLYPKSRILTLIPIIIIPWFVEIPAFVFLGLWFVIQFLNAAGSNAGAGIAWWAHIGGFIAGMVLLRLNTKLPQTGAGEKLQQYTARKKTPRPQRILVSGVPDSPDLQGEIEINSLEAFSGVLKMVTIPWGFYRPLYRVKIPPGVRDGTRLRLSRMGKTLSGGLRGDLYLKVKIKNDI